MPFLSEAVEASWYYFFEKWFMKLKIYNLLKPLGTITQQNYWSFYPSDLIYFAFFTMRHPVVRYMRYAKKICTAGRQWKNKYPRLKRAQEWAHKRARALQKLLASPTSRHQPPPPAAAASRRCQLPAVPVAGARDKPKEELWLLINEPPPLLASTAI